MEILADAPGLHSGVEIQDGADPLQVGYDSIPVVVDWNNDGRKDLVVGQHAAGYVWLFLNVNTDADPVFNGGTLIESRGSPITTSVS